MSISIPQPSQHDANGEHQDSKWYLCHFRHSYLDFRIPEIESLAHMFGVDRATVQWRPPTCQDPEMNPLWYVSLPSDAVVEQIASRMLLAKAFYEVWGEGGSWEELEAAIKSYPAHLQQPWLEENLSFKVEVVCFGKTLSQEDKLVYMDRLQYIDFRGKVKLKNPDVHFWLCIVDADDTPGLVERGSLPYRIYFGRRIATYEQTITLKYKLTDRPYIGTTSMDPELAFIMCNQAQVRAGQLVFDPYMGTGSIAISAAHYGAFVMGCDIDVRVIKYGKTDAQGQPLDVTSNFKHYNMTGRLAGLWAMDMHTTQLRNDGLEGMFHSIIGDPPYGVRAGGRKLQQRDIWIKDPTTHIIGTAPYTLGECLRDLLEFSSCMLVLGGRLVFFMPATPETYCDEELPAHPMMRIVANSEQLLHRRYSRRLITMEKILPYDAQATAAFYAARPDPTMKIDNIHEIVYEVLPKDENGKPIEKDGLPGKKYRSKRV